METPQLAVYRAYSRDGYLFDLVSHLNIQHSSPDLPDLRAIMYNSYVNDWNGDGITDAYLFSKASGGNTFFVSSGSSSYRKVTNPINQSSFSGSENQYLTSDFTADGLTDILRFNRDNGSSLLYRNQGEVSFSTKSTGSLYSERSSISDVNGSLYTGDFNGDGLLDTLWVNSTNGTNRLYLNTSTPPDLLKTVTTGLGSTTTFEYKPGTDASVYTKDTGSNASPYPNVDFVAPMQLVSKVKADDGVGGIYESTYKYVGGKFHAQGRGFLGFRQYLAKDEQTGVEQVMTYRQDFPFIGAVGSDQKKIGSSSLNLTSNTYDTKTIGSGAKQRVFPYIKQTVEGANDLDGTAFPIVTTDYAYDNYGNATKVTVSTPDGASKITTSTYINDESKWHIGRLLTADVTSTVPDTVPTATGAGAGAPGSDGDTPKAHGVIVVPLNGFTVIPLQ